MKKTIISETKEINIPDDEHCGYMISGTYDDRHVCTNIEIRPIVGKLPMIYCKQFFTRIENIDGAYIRCKMCIDYEVKNEIT